MRTKYTEAQRRELLRAWKQSKKGVAEFCESRGIVACTFYGWLRRGDPSIPNVRLVEAVPVVESPCALSLWAWELVGPTATLRGHQLDNASLQVLASAVVGKQR
jgi:hypothetical protein